ncbi:IclR family transcriptional regulator [Loktanella sp. IMCC34160]|uniref:IclR family transcriptional regulator n=1 Tax=Loktanella sp. IMCC34160 TaxID=2510646 RepID=UPI00101B6568|nr:IclR family transcriptional regulator [Loktanella sp. IMCC34160]RYG90306.1 IclR family transcriptional regulator [Loktanella sp. IMCC34160]
MGTITKALEMLNFFSRSRSHIGLSEFVKLTGRDKATVHRHLVELEENGFLEQDSVSRAYRLGPAILRLTGVREAAIPVRTVVRPIVRALAEDVGELAHVSLLQGRMLSPVFHFDPFEHGTQVHFDEAEMLPLHATSSGIALLAFGAEGLRNAVLSGALTEFTPDTPTDSERLKQAIEDARRAGYSRLDRAFDREVSSQGAPIFDAGGIAIGAVSVAVPAVRATPEKLETIKGKLLAAAAKLTESLGGRPSPAHPSEPTTGTASA